MGTIFMIHRLFGGMILPLLLLGAAIWFTVSWKPETWPGRPAQLFHILVDIQFTLGLTFWLYMIVMGASAYYLAFPFLLHPILGLLAATLARQAVRQNGLATRLGRWAPLATLGLVLVVVLAAGTVASIV
jgi:hypothetical protein